MERAVFGQLSVFKFLPAYMEPVDISLFYPNTIMPGTEGVGDVPITNFLCAIISLAYLALLMKNDNEGARARARRGSPT